MEKLKPVIVGGFTSEVISAARDVLFDTVDERDKGKEMNVRRKGHRQTGKLTVTQMNVSDIAKVFTERVRVGVSLPKFAAINLNSLPRMPYEQCGIPLE